MSVSLSLEGLKDQAKSLRKSLERAGQVISHSQALETVAHQHGYKDWNTLHAAAGNLPPPLQLGQVVTGKYLGQSFIGEVIALSDIGGQFTRITLRFDEPVDVITFESWSSFRKQVNATVDRYGCTIEKTSNGKPHLQLDLR